MTKRVKWSVTAAIVLMIAGMIAYPQIKSRMKASKDAAEVVPPAGSQVRKQVLNINAEVLKYQSLTDKTIVTGSTIPDEEVDLSFESSGKIVAIYFTEGTHVKSGDLLAKINDKPLQAELKKLEAQVPLAKDRVYRQHTLLEKDAVSQEAYEQVATEYEKLMAEKNCLQVWGYRRMMCRLSPQAGREMPIRMRLASGAAMRRYRQNAAYGTAGQCTGERSDFRHMSVTGGGWSMKKRNRMWKR